MLYYVEVGNVQVLVVNQLWFIMFWKLFSIVFCISNIPELLTSIPVFKFEKIVLSNNA